MEIPEGGRVDVDIHAQPDTVALNLLKRLTVRGEASDGVVDEFAESANEPR